MMNPTISKIVQKCYESDLPIDDFVWFSFESNQKVRGELSGKEITPEELKNIKLPFPKTAVAAYGVHADGTTAIQSGRFWFDEDDVLQIAMHVVNNETGKLLDVVISPEFSNGDSGLSVSCDGDISETELTAFCSNALGLFAEFNYWITRASTEPVNHGHASKLTGTGRRQLAAGKSPLITWKTVAIEPSAPKQPHKGGTHASPKQHGRRAHPRTLKNGSRIWISSCIVGKAIDGLAFHDYSISTVENTDQ